MGWVSCYNGGMVDRETFNRYVAEALGRFYDYAYLGRHPLAELLGTTEHPASPEKVRRALRDAIEQLRPSPATAKSPYWRRYQHLVLRYVEVQTLEDIARNLGVSLRQAHRDHIEAREAVAAILYNRYVLSRGITVRPNSDQAQEAGAGDADGGEAILETEIGRLELASIDEPLDLTDVLQGVLATIAPLTQITGVTSELIAPTNLMVNHINRAIIRQVLLDLLAYAIECQAAEHIRLSVDSKPNGIEVALAIHRQQVPAQSSAPESSRPFEMAHRLAEIEGWIVDVTEDSCGCQRLLLCLPRQMQTTVLLIDDNPDLGRLFRRYLQGRNYRLIQATNASRALSLAKDHRPDVIILDVLIPSQDGWEILQELRSDAKTSDIPVVVCSVLPEHGLARSLAGAEFLAKPVAEAALVEILVRFRR